VGTATAAFNESLRKLGFDYVDLYLLHSPNPGVEKRQASWKELIALQQQGKIRSIGVSNFGVHHLEEFLKEFPDHPPAVNQIELHPWLTHTDITQFCRDHSIVIEAYSPLAKARKMDNPTLISVADEYKKTPAQILLRWSLQKGYVVLVKSEKKERIIANADIWGWELPEEAVKRLDSFNDYFPTGWDPTKEP